MEVYLNYPNPRITIHTNINCGEIGKMKKEGQRKIRIDLFNLSSELINFKKKEYVFGSNEEKNDMWLVIDLGDRAFEQAIVSYIQKLVSKHYTPFGRVNIELHC